MNVRIPLKEDTDGKFLHIDDQSIIAICTMIGVYILYILYIYISEKAMVYTEKAMATHSSTLAWKIPWMEEPGRLQSMGS